MNKKDLFKNIISVLKCYYKYILGIIIIVFLVSGCNLIVPCISKIMIDDGFIAGSYRVILCAIGQVMLITLICQLLSIVKEKMRVEIKAKLSISLFKDIFNKLGKINYQYFKENNYSEIMERVGTDVGKISSIVNESLLAILEQLLMMIGGIISLLLISWQLGLLILIYVPIKVLIMNYLGKRREKIAHKYIQSRKEYAHWFGDSVAGIQEIKLYGVIKEKLSEMDEKVSKVTSYEKKSALLDTINSSIETILVQGINSLVYIVGAMMMFKLKITVGGVISFVTYSMYVIKPISYLSNIQYIFADIIPSAKRYFEFLAMKEEEDTCSDEKINNIDLIEFNNVEFSYNDSDKILRNISFSIKKNEKVAIIGSNGAGKSTIVNLLLRFYVPDEGCIRINNKDIKQFNLEDYRYKFGVINQNIYIFDSTIEDNIKMYSYIDETEYLDVLKEVNLYDFVKSLHKNYKVGQNGMMLSGGQRQKIAIARAIVRNKPIFVFDEVTNNMDLESEYRVNELFNTRLKDKMVLVITHSISHIDQYDKVIFLKDGLIDDIGNHEELIKNNHNYRSYIGSINN